MVQLNGKEVAIFLVDGSYYALDNACPHAGGPLADGFLEGSVVTCPWHMWQFDVRNGACTFDESICVDSYQVRVDGEAILLAHSPKQGA
jgi:nitrite reductase/ring-hydroxylating ferredoxin subunit